MTDTRIATTSAVDPQISGAMAVFDRLKPLKEALGVENLNDNELQLFAMVAYQTGLDPFTRQIYAIKRGGKVTHQTGIDGYRAVAERTHEYAGSDEAEYESCPCGKGPKDHPAIARVNVRRMLRNGQMVHQVGVARWHELIPSPPSDAMWQKMPFNQLAKCAEANGLRKLFPRVLGGVYIEEEMQQAGPAENPALVAAAAQPTARQRIAARREAVETTDPVVIDQEPAGAGFDGFDDEDELPTPATKEEAQAFIDLIKAENKTRAEVDQAVLKLYGDRSLKSLSAGELRDVALGLGLAVPA